MKRIICIPLLLCLALGCFSGCGGASDAEYKSVYDFEKYSPTIELTTDRWIESEDGITDWENDPYIRWAEVNLGIKWVPKFVATSKQEHDEKLMLLASADNLPDVICDAPSYLVKEWYQNGFLRVLEDDINEWGSDLTKYIINDEYKKQTNNTGFAGFTNDDGKYYALPMVLNVSTGDWSKYFYRADILEELGMKEPTTVKELENVLEAYTQKYPNQPAIFLDDYLFSAGMPLFEIFGSYASMFYEKNGEIIYGSLTSETKTMLAKLRDWYKKGYIAKDFDKLQYQPEMDKVAQGEYFLVPGQQWFPKWMAPKLNEKKSNAKFLPLGNIADDTGKVNTYYASFFIQYPAVITKNCEHPEAVIKEMNILYESGLRNDQDLRDMGFEFRWPVTPLRQPINADEVAEKGIDYAKYDYTEEEVGPHFLNQGPTNPVSICYGNANSRAVSADSIDYEGTLALLRENNYDMNATYNAIPDELKAWFDNNFISNPEAKGNPWGCEATLINEIQINNGIKSGQIITDGGWTSAYTGQAYDDYFVALQDVERDFFTDIITGERPLDDFDLFVTTWRENGGDQILKEKNDMYNAMNK